MADDIRGEIGAREAQPVEDRSGDGRRPPDLPQPLPEPPPMPTPRDAPFPGTIRLFVDATDVQRRIFQVREIIPVPTAGRMTLLYPKWVPGFHSPATPIELMAGLEVTAGGRRLDWRRDPVEMHAFHLEVPEGVEELEVRFQFLSPTSEAQGTVMVSANVMIVRWSSLVVYPAGWFSRGIEVAATLALPPGWTGSSSLEHEVLDTGLAFAPTGLDVLVDAPAMAGRWSQRVDLGEAVALYLFGEVPDALSISDEQIAVHRSLVEQADLLFGARHFDRYHFHAVLSDELGGGGVEHQRCCELVLRPDHFSAWDRNAPRRDVAAHEYVHSWNGKFRRGHDSWTPSFERPIRNSLMWVYEGLTQYWGEVLAARSGLWTPQHALDSLARTAAVCCHRPGGRWRPMSDTTRDPIIAARTPLPWASWQRSEDYYSEGQLLWLEIDTLIRELSDDARSLDDFARAFFGVQPGRTETLVYSFEDVVRALGAVAANDWAGLLTRRLQSREEGVSLDGLTRGGYRLVYLSEQNALAAQDDALAGVEDHRCSIGLMVSNSGVLEEVVWESPAFRGGFTAGATLLAVDGRPFAPGELARALAGAGEAPLNLMVRQGNACRTVAVERGGGPRHPHLEPIEGARRRLDEILSPRS